MRSYIRFLAATLFACTAAASAATPVAADIVLREYPTPAGSRPHDAVPDRWGWAWYVGQGDGTVGLVDPSTGVVRVIPLGAGSAPHGIIFGPDDGVWITDGGLNAIVRVDPWTLEHRVFPLNTRPANLNTPAFDGRGVLWFTGQNGIIGRLDPAVGVVQTWDAPRGRGPYGIAATPDGTVYFASLAGSYLGRIDGDDGRVTVIDPPTPNAGVRRVWSDSTGRLWIAEYNVGQLGMYDPATGNWREWPLPGAPRARAYAVYVDHDDIVWLSDTGNDTIVRFDPTSETFSTVEISRPSNVAQLGGNPGEVWGAQRARNHIFVLQTR